VEVLVEGASKVPGRMTGRTSQHRLVHFPSEDLELVGQYAPVRVTEALAHSCVGELLAHDAAEAGAGDDVLEPQPGDARPGHAKRQASGEGAVRGGAQE